LLEDGGGVEGDLGGRVDALGEMSRRLRAELDHEELARMGDGEGADLAQRQEPGRRRGEVHAEGARAQLAIEIREEGALPVSGAEGTMTCWLRARRAHQEVVVDDDDRGGEALEGCADGMADGDVNRMGRVEHHSYPQERHRHAGGYGIPALQALRHAPHGLSP
jgi:hypothetical protein